ncbi:MAG: Bax inhibitor-1/YccA family protein [Candidatus Melainabacteria bacterium]
MRTSNPALSDKAFAQTDVIRRTGGPITGDTGAMTVKGTVNKTALMLGILVLTAGWTWMQAMAGVNVSMWLMFGAIGGFVVAMFTIFKKDMAPITAPLYAALEGLVLGGVSAVFEVQYHGIVIQAVGLTFGVLAALLLVYQSGLIKVTDNFRMGLLAATGGIALVYLASFVMGFFGIHFSFLYDSSPMSIGISVFVVIIAALNLVLDFDFIERGAAQGAPRYMEWYGAFGLMVTLVWLYLEILRLLAKTQRRN